MRRLVIVILLVCFVLLGGRVVLGPAVDPLDGRVTRVVDGDTLHVRIGGRDETVRLLGIDTPELHKPDTPVECGARGATRALTRIATGRRVTVIGDSGQDERDRYGRLPGYVETEAGLDLGEELVRRGWAAVYVYDGDPFERVGRYRAAAAAAADAGVAVAEHCNGDFHSSS